MNWTEFFAMGGYAPYVWGVYGIALVVLVYNVLQPFLHRRALLQRLRDYYRLRGKSA